MDVTLGVAWWVVKNTVYGTYCLGSYLFCTTEPPKEDKDVLELKYQIAELNKKLDRISSMNDLTIMSSTIVQNTLVNQPLSEDKNKLEDNLIKPIELPNTTDIDDAFILVDE